MYPGVELLDDVVIVFHFLRQGQTQRLLTLLWRVTKTMTITSLLSGGTGVTHP